MKERYSRQMILPGFGLEAQQKLATLRVLVVGAGGLGCPVLLYLAAAGAGHIGIVDGDTVELSNLHRQVLYSAADVGQNKAKVAGEKLAAQFPEVQFSFYPSHLVPENALELIGGYDLVIDGSDNFATRYLVNDACVLAGKPLVWGTVYQYEGQLSVFNYQPYIAGGTQSVNLRCIFPEQPAADSVPNCAEAGVLGASTGWLGSAMALEAIKVLTGIGETIAGSLVTFNALTHEVRKLQLTADPENPLFTGGILSIEPGRYLDAACEVPAAVVSLSPVEWDQFLNLHPKAMIVDVRQPWEHAEGNLGGVNIPLDTLAGELGCMDTGSAVLLYCQRGQRSTAAARLLLQAGYKDVYSLAGGLEAYALASRKT